MYFDMRSMALPIECAHEPQSMDCHNAEVVASDLVVTKLTLEVREPFGAYGHCTAAAGESRPLCPRTAPIGRPGRPI